MFLCIVNSSFTDESHRVRIPLSTWQLSNPQRFSDIRLLWCEAMSWKSQPSSDAKAMVFESSSMPRVCVYTNGHTFLKSRSCSDIKNKATKKPKVKFMRAIGRYPSSKLSVFQNITLAYVKTTLNLHFIKFSAFALSEFIYWKKDITHNNSLLILKEASCVFKKYIKQLFPDEGSL